MSAAEQAKPDGVNPRYTPEGKLTLWGVTCLYVSRLQNDRFSGYSRFNGPSLIAQTPYGQEVWDRLVLELEAEGKLDVKRPDPIEYFVRRTTPKAQ